MGLIKEPFDLDFVMEPKPLSKEEFKKISDYINADKRNKKILKANQEQQNRASVKSIPSAFMVSL